MDKTEFELLEKATVRNLVVVDDFKNKTPRTLIYGYTCNRETFHLYLENGMFNLLVYNGTNPVSVDVLESWSKKAINLDSDYFVPAKRIYPAACDYEFCLMLTKAGKTLPFTTWDDRPEQQFYGAVGPF